MRALKKSAVIDTGAKKRRAQPRSEAADARRDAATAAAEADELRRELRDALRVASAAEAHAAAMPSPARPHANGNVSEPQQPTANGHVSDGGIEDAAQAAGMDALRAENAALREKLQSVDKRIAGAAACRYNHNDDTWTCPSCHKSGRCCHRVRHWHSQEPESSCCHIGH